MVTGLNRCRHARFLLSHPALLDATPKIAWRITDLSDSRLNSDQPLARAEGLAQHLQETGKEQEE
jgi:hypothetical protein